MKKVITEIDRMSTTLVLAGLVFGMLATGQGLVLAQEAPTSTAPQVNEGTQASDSTNGKDKEQIVPDQGHQVADDGAAFTEVKDLEQEFSFIPKAGRYVMMVAKGKALRIPYMWSNVKKTSGFRMTTSTQLGAEPNAKCPDFDPDWKNLFPSRNPVLEITGGRQSMLFVVACRKGVATIRFRGEQEDSNGYGIVECELRVIVESDTSEIDAAIKDAVPQAEVRVIEIRDSAAVIVGKAPTRADIRVVYRIAQLFYSEVIVDKLVSSEEQKDLAKSDADPRAGDDAVAESHESEPRVARREVHRVDDLKLLRDDIRSLRDDVRRLGDLIAKRQMTKPQEKGVVQQVPGDGQPAADALPLAVEGIINKPPIRNGVLFFWSKRSELFAKMLPMVSRLERQGYPIRFINVETEQPFEIDTNPSFVLVSDGKELTRKSGTLDECGLIRLFEPIANTFKIFISSVDTGAKPFTIKIGQRGELEFPYRIKSVSGHDSVVLNADRIDGKTVHVQGKQAGLVNAQVRFVDNEDMWNVFIRVMPLEKHSISFAESKERLESISLRKSENLDITFDDDLSVLRIMAPEIVDIIQQTSKQMHLCGLAVGTTDVVATSMHTGYKARLKITVEPPDESVQHLSITSNTLVTPLTITQSPPSELSVYLNSVTNVTVDDPSVISLANDSDFDWKLTGSKAGYTILEFTRDSQRSGPFNTEERCSIVVQVVPPIAGPSVDKSPHLKVVTYSVGDLFPSFSDTVAGSAHSKLAQRIIASIDPQSWDVNGGESTIKPFDATGSLVIRATDQTHQKIMEFLGKIRTEQARTSAVGRALLSVASISTEKMVNKDSPNPNGSDKPRKVNGLGTGIMIDERGYLLTCHHVIQDVDTIRVELEDETRQKKTYIAKKISFDREADLALIKIDDAKPFKVARLGSSAEIAISQPVLAIGNSYGYHNTVTMGNISGLGRQIDANESRSYKNLIQTDAAINPGNSGGPLINMDGEVIGIAIAIRANSSAGFALPIDDVRRLIANLMHLENREGAANDVDGNDAEQDRRNKYAVMRREPESPASEGSSSHVIKTYAVADLVMPKANSEKEKTDFSGVVKRITETIDPDCWKENGGDCTIEVYPPVLSLVVRASQLTHAQISDLLSQMRRENQKALVDKVRPSVANIRTEKAARGGNVVFQQNRKINGMGSGIVVDERGYIVTSYHVVADVDAIGVDIEEEPGKLSNYVARMVRTDREHDLAIIKIDAPKLFRVLPTGISSKLKVGQDVIALGNSYLSKINIDVATPGGPAGEELRNRGRDSAGVIYSLGRDIDINDMRSYKGLIQTTASLNPGYSGGPLINLDGELIGINVALRAISHKIGFAIPIDDARKSIAKMMSIEFLDGNFHGFFTTDVKTGPICQLIVEGMHAGDPAFVAGFRHGDVIVKAGTVDVFDAVDLERGLLHRTVDEKIPVTVKRGENTGTIDLVLVKFTGRRDVLDLDVNNVKPDRVWTQLGLRLEVLPANERGQLSKTKYRGGMRILEVEAESPAALNGITNGDILVGLDKWETMSGDNVTWILNQVRNEPGITESAGIKYFIVRNQETKFGHLPLPKP